MYIFLTLKSFLLFCEIMGSVRRGTGKKPKQKGITSCV
jgi:hypothetical protein